MQEPQLHFSNVSLEKVEALRRQISHLFAVGNTTLDEPDPGYVRFRGRFIQDPADCFNELRDLFEAQGFTPMIREQDGSMILIGMPVVFHDSPGKWQINLLLFLATIVTTLITGALYADIQTNEEMMYNLTHFWIGWDYSLSIMLILAAIF